MKLRPYQQAALDALYAHFRERDDNPCVVIPTGGGKTPLLATVCKDAVRWKSRVLVLAHVKELLEQALDKLHIVAPELDSQVGLYCAGLKSRDTTHPVLVASIQSIYKRAGEIGPFDLVIVDEAHRISPDGETMYTSLLADLKKQNPALRVLGLTATPYRMKEGMICGFNNILNHVCYEVGVRELIEDGYLCPIISKGGRYKVDTSKLHVRGGEYVPAEAEALMSDENVVGSACADILLRTKESKATLIFAAGVAHGHLLAETLYDQLDTGDEFFGSVPRVACVFGETPPSERAEILTSFKAGKVKYLINCQVLTLGFDAPNIDCVAMVRPTKSPGLYYQMVGRGLRTAPDKERCVILDFGNNVLEHGPIDALQIKQRGGDGTGEAPAKQCPSCATLIPAGCLLCPECGLTFPKPEPKHTGWAADVAIISPEKQTRDVVGTTYHIHHKVGDPDAPTTLRVEYEVGWNTYVREWVCLNHEGYARSKACAWWALRSNADVPDTTEAALALALDGALAETTAVTTKQDGKWERIVSTKIGPIPPWREPGCDDEPPSRGLIDKLDPEDIPF